MTKGRKRKLIDNTTFLTNIEINRIYHMNYYHKNKERIKFKRIERLKKLYGN
jgi:hypothetical protein